MQKKIFEYGLLQMLLLASEMPQVCWESETMTEIFDASEAQLFKKQCPSELLSSRCFPVECSWFLICYKDLELVRDCSMKIVIFSLPPEGVGGGAQMLLGATRMDPTLRQAGLRQQRLGSTCKNTSYNFQ